MNPTHSMPRDDPYGQSYRLSGLTAAEWAYVNGTGPHPSTVLSALPATS